MIGIKSLRRSVLLYKWVCFVVVFIVFASAWPHLPNMLCQPCLFHTFLFSLHSIPFDDPLQSFREFCSYLIIFIKHNILFYLIMTFSVFPNLRCPGVTKHGQNSESADQDSPDAPGFLSFSHTVRAQTAASFPDTYTPRWPYCLHRSTVWLENLFKIGITSAKTSCSKQKNLFIF